MNDPTVPVAPSQSADIMTNATLDEDESDVEEQLDDHFLKLQRRISSKARGEGGLISPQKSSSTRENDEKSTAAPSPATEAKAKPSHSPLLQVEKSPQPAQKDTSPGRTPERGGSVRNSSKLRIPDEVYDFTIQRTSDRIQAFQCGMSLLPVLYPFAYWNSALLISGKCNVECASCLSAKKNEQLAEYLQSFNRILDPDVVAMSCKGVTHPRTHSSGAVANFRGDSLILRASTFKLAETYVSQQSLSDDGTAELLTFLPGTYDTVYALENALAGYAVNVYAVLLGHIKGLTGIPFNVGFCVGDSRDWEDGGQAFDLVDPENEASFTCLGSPCTRAIRSPQFPLPFKLRHMVVQCVLNQVRARFGCSDTGNAPEATAFDLICDSARAPKWDTNAEFSLEKVSLPLVDNLEKIKDRLQESRQSYRTRRGLSAISKRQLQNEDMAASTRKWTHTFLKRATCRKIMKSIAVLDRMKVGMLWQSMDNFAASQLQEDLLNAPTAEPKSKALDDPKVPEVHIVVEPISQDGGTPSKRAQQRAPKGKRKKAPVSSPQSKRQKAQKGGGTHAHQKSSTTDAVKEPETPIPESEAKGAIKDSTASRKPPKKRNDYVSPLFGSASKNHSRSPDGSEGNKGMFLQRRDVAPINISAGDRQSESRPASKVPGETTSIGVGCDTYVSSLPRIPVQAVPSALSDLQNCITVETEVPLYRQDSLVSVAEQVSPLDAWRFAGGTRLHFPDGVCLIGGSTDAQRFASLSNGFDLFQISTHENAGIKLTATIPLRHTLVEVDVVRSLARIGILQSLSRQLPDYRMRRTIAVLCSSFIASCIYTLCYECGFTVQGAIPHENGPHTLLPSQLRVQLVHIAQSAVMAVLDGQRRVVRTVDPVELVKLQGPE